jgi:hypothetical protein
MEYDRPGMAAKTVAVIDPLRGVDDLLLLCWASLELRIVRFRVRAANSSTTWNKSMRVGFLLAGMYRT